MKTESSPSAITVSLEWAKKLKEAGWHQGWTGVGTLSSFAEKPETMKADIMGTYFKWFDVRSDYTKGEPYPQVESIYCNYPMIADAPTAEEILRRLPQIIEHTGLIVTRSQNDKEWEVAYLGSKPARDSSLANAAAAMWCFLKSHNLL